MKLPLLALVAVVLAPIVAPMAQAEDCSTLDAVIASGHKDEFEGIFNGDEIGDGVYETTLTFAKADACEVDSFEPYYYCRWDRGSATDADKVILPLYDMAKVCLSEGYTWDDLAGKKSILGATILEGYSMTKTAGDYKGGVVRLCMHAGDKADARQVWLEVAPY